MQEQYGQLWGDLEREPRVRRDVISRVCGLLATIHLRQARGSSNEYEDLEKLYRSLTRVVGPGAAGLSFFDGVLQPYVKVWRCGWVRLGLMSGL